MVGSLISGVANAFTGIANTMLQAGNEVANRDQAWKINQANIEAQKYINMKNLENQQAINQSQLDFARALTQQQWERDDNAHQREVADLVKAGLSPLANTAGASVTSGHMPSAVMAEQVAPHAEFYRSQAPQIEMAGLTSSLAQLDKNIQFEKSLIRQDRSLDLEAERVKQSASSLDIERSKVDNELVSISNAYDLGCKQLSQSMAELKEKRYQYDTENNKWLVQSIRDNSLKIAESIRSAQNQGYTNVSVYTDIDKYQNAMLAYGKKLETFLKTHKIARTGGISGSLGSGGFENGSLQGLSKGSGSNFGLSFGWKPNEKREEIMYRQFLAENPFPVFASGYVDYEKYHLKPIYRD